MKLGLHIGYWGLGLTAPQQLELVLEAERLGYDSVWTAEAYGSDAATILAWLAQATSTIKLGSAIFQMPGRSAAMTAMTAATIDQLSDGRMLLGIGSSGPQVAEGWHGQRFAKQLQRTREYVDVVKLALSRERVVYEGETLQLPLPDGPGKALKLTIRRCRSGSRSTSPRSARRTRRWRPRSPTAGCRRCSPPSTSASSGRCWRRASRAPAAARASTDFDIVPTVTAMVSDDLESARDAMRHYVALYTGGMGSRKQNFYNALMRRYGFEEAADTVQELYLAGKKDEAAASLPGELIDTVALVGPPDIIRERLRVYRDAGVGTLMISPMAWTFEDRVAQLRTIAELVE